MFDCRTSTADTPDIPAYSQILLRQRFFHLRTVLVVTSTRIIRRVNEVMALRTTSACRHAVRTISSLHDEEPGV